MTQVKRFIAGARCPQCQQIDKIRCWRDGELYKSECVHCGYSETMNAAGERVDTVQVIRVPQDE